jgi:hypothetical protein
MHGLSAAGHCRTHGLLPACFLHAHLLHAHLLLLINWFQLVVVWWPLARCGARYFLPARLPARLLAGSRWRARWALAVAPLDTFFFFRVWPAWR